MNKFVTKQLNKNNKLLKHTAIVFGASIFSSGFNYLYHLFMGRTLGPEQYGILGSLFAIIYIIGVINGTITWVTSRFVTQYNVKKQYGKIKTLLLTNLKYTSLIGILAFGIFALLSGVIASFLNIDSRIPVLMVALYGFLTLLNPTFSGVLNGLQKFEWTSLIGIGSTFTKLAIGIILVLIGYGVNGALGAVIVSSLVALGLGAVVLRKIFVVKSEKIKGVHVMKYIGPVFFGTVLLMVIINIDIILVKHFFPELQAGYYAAASMIAKIVLFASGAIVGVMFPKVADLHDRKKDVSKILKATMFYVAIISFMAVIVYFTIPSFVVNLLYGSSYKISNIIGLFGLALAFYSLSNVLVLYNLALKKKNFVYAILFALIVEIVSIILFHNTLVEIVKIMVVVNAMLFALMLITVRKELGFNNVQIISNSTSV